jgi:prepilin-type N-terminal cleavage/methylation domain-containing protein
MSPKKVSEGRWLLELSPDFGLAIRLLLRENFQESTRTGKPDVLPSFRNFPFADLPEPGMTTPPRTAFSLMELLVCLTIAAILIGLLLPAIAQVREASRRTLCSSNTRQLALALHLYENNFQKLPPTATIASLPEGGIRTEYLGPLARLLPFIELNHLFSGIDPRQIYGSAANREAVSYVIPFLLCPSETRPEPLDHQDFGRVGGNNYAFCMGDWFVWGGLAGNAPVTRSAFGVNLTRSWGGFGWAEQHPDFCGSQKLSGLAAGLWSAAGNHRSRSNPLSRN